MKNVKLFCIFASFVLLFMFSCNKENEKVEVGEAKFGTPMNFTSTDLDGNTVTNEIFKKADLTLINIWATWCGPCKAELPGLAKIAEKYSAQGYQVIGFVQDVTGEENVDIAKSILADAGVKFTVVKNDPSMDAIYADLEAFPTTLFVDKDGNLVGTEHIGFADEAGFDALFQKAIETLKNK
ncbi:MAG: TlpA disulfide reductase family protein [Treponemataceae bacterium]